MISTLFDCVPNPINKRQIPRNFASRKLLQLLPANSAIFLKDHLYVQYVELNQFQNEFRELANKFGENEKIIKKLSVR